MNKKYLEYLKRQEEQEAKLRSWNGHIFKDKRKKLKGRLREDVRT